MEYGICNIYLKNKLIKMGQSIKKRQHKIYSKNRANKVKNRKMIEKNAELLKKLKSEIE